MKRFILLAVAAAALLVPTFARAQGSTFVYRPELRQWVVAPPPVEAPKAAPLTPAERIAKHEAMGRAYRGTRMAQSAAHCDRMIQEAREALRKQS